MQPQFADRNAHQLSARQFVFHADLRQQRHAVTDSNEAFDRLQRRQFDIHVQGSLMTLKRLNHFLAIGRSNDMSNEGLSRQLAYANMTLARQWMPRTSHCNQYM